MASKKLVFKEDEVKRLQTKIGQVSEDTNLLYLQLRGQASNWGGLPLDGNLLEAQVLINELTVEAEKLENMTRVAIKGVQGVQDENKRQANQLSQQFNTLGGMFGSIWGIGGTGRLPIPTFAQKASTNLISKIATLTGWDELNYDPMVQKLQATLKNPGVGTVDSITAQSKLQDIYNTRDLIAKAQTAFKVYQAFGNKSQMENVHQLAEDARKKLESMGVDTVHYQAGKDLSTHFKQPAVKACDYDPSITTSSVPLLDNETYAFLLRMAMGEGIKGDWAKQQLAMMNPQATIGPHDPHNSVPGGGVLWDQVAIGLLQAVGGGFETGFGVVFGTATSETVVGGLFGAYVANHGASNVSGGISRLWNGFNGSNAGDTANYEKNMFEAIGGEQGEQVYNGIDIATSFAQPVDMVTKMVYKAPTVAMEAYQAEKVVSKVGGVFEGTGEVISEADRLKLSEWKYRPSEELYIKYKKVFDNSKYYDQSTGEIKWPINDGFFETIAEEVTLMPGTRIDRFGFESGTFVSPEGIPYELRSLAPGTNNKPYHVYEVLKPIDGLGGEIATWFDEVGGGIQYKLTKTIEELIDDGYLREVFN